MGICKAATNDPTWIYYFANKNTKIQIPFRSTFYHSFKRISYRHGIDRSIIIEAKDYLDFRFRRSSLAVRWYRRCILRWTARFMHSIQSELNWMTRPESMSHTCLIFTFIKISKGEEKTHTHASENKLRITNGFQRKCVGGWVVGCEGRCAVSVTVSARQSKHTRRSWIFRLSLSFYSSLNISFFRIHRTSMELFICAGDSPQPGPDVRHALFFFGCVASAGHSVARLYIRKWAVKNYELGKRCKRERTKTDRNVKEIYPYAELMSLFDVWNKSFRHNAMWMMHKWLCLFRFVLSIVTFIAPIRFLLTARHFVFPCFATISIDFAIFKPNRPSVCHSVSRRPRFVRAILPLSR